MKELAKLRRTTCTAGLLHTNDINVEYAYTKGWNDCIDYLAEQGRIVPKDWVAVPKESTTHMYDEGDRICISAANKEYTADADQVYKAMLAVAPKPFESEEE